MSTYTTLYSDTETRLLEDVESIRRRALHEGAPLVAIVPGARGADGVIDVAAIAGGFDTLHSEQRAVLLGLCTRAVDAYSACFGGTEADWRKLARGLRDIATVADRIAARQ